MGTRKMSSRHLLLVVLAIIVLALNLVAAGSVKEDFKADAQKTLMRMDTNQDHHVDLKELQAYIKERSYSDNAAALMKELDDTKDGQLTATEVMHPDREL